jgi:D-glycero-alpha-D-manno-heptose 1-phosphate guanylyltransferase
MSLAPHTAIVLAGGLGTRLRTVVSDLPKPMAPIGELPFLHYILRYLEREGVREVILSVGYKHETIQAYFGTVYGQIALRYAIETEPLGTGGGIYQAMQLVTGDCFIINGDTFFEVSLTALADFFYDTPTDLALSLKPMSDLDRYGTVTIDTETFGRVLSFNEKQPLASGLINGGVYLASRSLFDRAVRLTGEPLPAIFSFEKEILEKHTQSLSLRAEIFDNYFIDIGIPTDYARAQQELVARVF